MAKDYYVDGGFSKPLAVDKSDSEDSAEATTSKKLLDATWMDKEALTKKEGNAFSKRVSDDSSYDTDCLPNKVADKFVGMQSLKKQQLADGDLSFDKDPYGKFGKAVQAEMDPYGKFDKGKFGMEQKIPSGKPGQELAGELEKAPSGKLGEKPTDLMKDSSKCPDGAKCGDDVAKQHVLTEQMVQQLGRGRFGDEKERAALSDLFGAQSQAAGARGEQQLIDKLNAALANEHSGFHVQFGRNIIKTPGGRRLEIVDSHGRVADHMDFIVPVNGK